MKLNKFAIIIPLLILALAIGANIKVDSSNKTVLSEQSNKEEGNKQILELKAKGGYSPSIINAKANMDTVLRVKTNSTFDCSAALTIPKLGIRKNLPPSASTDIALGTQQAGTEIAGTCAMGMYNFLLKFN